MTEKISENKNNFLKPSEYEIFDIPETADTQKINLQTHFFNKKSEIFFSYKHTIFQNNLKIFKNADKREILNFKINHADLIFNSKNLLKFYAKNNADYLKIREFKSSEDILSFALKENGRDLCFLTEKYFNFVELEKPEIQKVEHKIKNLNSDSQIFYFEDSVLIKTTSEIFLWNSETEKMVKLFVLTKIREKLFGIKLLKIEITDNSVCLMTDKLIIWDDKIMHFRGAENCFIRNNKLIIKTKEKILIFNSKFMQIYDMKVGNNFMVVFEEKISNISTEKLVKFSYFLKNLKKEDFKKIEDDNFLNYYAKHHSMHENSINLNLPRPYSFLMHNKIYKKIYAIDEEEKSKKHKSSLFYTEKEKEVVELQNFERRLSEKDFLLKKHKYNIILNKFMQNDENNAIKLIKKYKTEGILKFVCLDESIRENILKFLSQKNILLRNSDLCVYVFEYIIKNFKVPKDFKLELHELLIKLYEVNKNACICYGMILNKL